MHHSIGGRFRQQLNFLRRPTDEVDQDHGLLRRLDSGGGLGAEEVRQREAAEAQRTHLKE